MPRNYFLINFVFIIIIGLLGFWFYKIWVRPIDIPAYAVQTAQQTDKQSVVRNKGKILSKSYYNVIEEKNLFRPSRTSSPEGSSFQQLTSRDKPKLFGTMIMGGKNTAILEDPSSKTTKLYFLNDSIAGFIISDIQKDRVILKKGENTFEIKLRDNKGIKTQRSQVKSSRRSRSSERDRTHSTQQRQRRPRSRTSPRPK